MFRVFFFLFFYVNINLKKYIYNLFNVNGHNNKFIQTTFYIISFFFSIKYIYIYIYIYIYYLSTFPSTTFCWVKGEEREKKRLIILCYIERKKRRMERNCFHGSTNIFFLLSLQIHKITRIPFESFNFL